MAYNEVSSFRSVDTLNGFMHTNQTLKPCGPNNIRREERDGRQEGGRGGRERERERERDLLLKDKGLGTNAS